jgi:hypothetical protein
MGLCDTRSLSCGAAAMKRASYREAIQWIVANDDTEWLHDEHGHPSVTAALVADIFDVDIEKVQKDLRREEQKAGIKP